MAVWVSSPGSVRIRATVEGKIGATEQKGKRIGRAFPDKEYKTSMGLARQEGVVACCALAHRR